jgi:hypothetical protein
LIAHQAVYEDESILATDETEAAYSERRLNERARQCCVLRCVVGNPFRTMSPDDAWRTPSSQSLAQAVYDERILPAGELDKVRLAILADALEEAGCTVPDLLDHLRAPGPHVRGCWPVDLLLARPERS